MPETFSAMAGWAASLEADAQAEQWDGESHGLVDTFTGSHGCYGICECGRRFDGIDRAHVEKQIVEHAEAVGA